MFKLVLLVSPTTVRLFLRLMCPVMYLFLLFPKSGHVQAYPLLMRSQLFRLLFQKLVICVSPCVFSQDC